VAEALRVRLLRAETRLSGDGLPPGAGAHDMEFRREVRRLLGAVPDEAAREALLLRLESGAASPAEQELVGSVEVLRLIVDLQRSV
jgi:hypothetical protein